MSQTRYCTQADLESRVSVLGVALRFDDASASVVNDCCDDASAWVDYYCAVYYTPQNLATSPWVKYRARDLALPLLCFRRLNTVPKKAEQLADAAAKELAKVQAGTVKIPGIPTRATPAPVLSQPRLIIWPYPYTAIERQRSTGNPQHYTPRDDPYEPPFPIR